MKNEVLINSLMVALVGVVVIGSGVTVYKNLLDKEAREKKEMIELSLKTPKVDKFVAVVATDSATMQSEGFILHEGLMYQTKGEATIPMIENVILPNETQVYKTGTVLRKDKSQLSLKEDQFINLNGEIMKSTRTIAPVTITEPVLSPTSVQ